MSESNNSLTAKLYNLIGRLRELIAREGKKISLIVIKPDVNKVKQMRRFLKACESKSAKVEAVVTTSLPGEEQVVWPFHNIQFYIREGIEEIDCTGNPDAVRLVFHDGPVPFNKHHMKRILFDRLVPGLIMLGIGIMLLVNGYINTISGHPLNIIPDTMIRLMRISGYGLTIIGGILTGLGIRFLKNKHILRHELF